MSNENVLWMLIAAGRRSQAQVEQVVRRYGLRMASFEVLRVLSEHRDGLTLQGIAERTSTHNPDLTRIIDRLVRCGYVYRVRPETGDRRHVYISLTPIGGEVFLGASAALSRQVEASDTSFVKAVFESLAAELAPCGVY